MWRRWVRLTGGTLVPRGLAPSLGKKKKLRPSRSRTLTYCFLVSEKKWKIDCDWTLKAFRAPFCCLVSKILPTIWICRLPFFPPTHHFLALLMPARESRVVLRKGLCLWLCRRTISSANSNRTSPVLWAVCGRFSVFLAVLLITAPVSHSSLAPGIYAGKGGEGFPLSFTDPRVRYPEKQEKKKKSKPT
jgi:hypothetical protein